MRRTAAAAGLLVAAGLSLTVTGTAHAAPDRDCPDFATQAEAQAAFDSAPGDAERLDADGDGQACEDFGYGAAPAQVPQVPKQPSGGVRAGDGSATQDGSTAVTVLVGGTAFAAAGGAALMARRRSRTAA